MAQADFTELSDGLPSASVDRGVTTGVAKPNSSGLNNFVFGFNSLADAEGAVGFHTNQTKFSPLVDDASPTPQPTGGSIRAVFQRGVSAAPLQFAPMLFIGLQGTSVNDEGYLLGLSDGDPHRISLRKGAVVDGIPDTSPGTSGVLRRSAGSFAPGTYLHLRLDMVVNDFGDVILKVFRNDLSVNPVGSAPSWQAVPGMDDFVDDQLGINSGSQPFIGGYAGYAFYTKNVSRRAFFDQIEIYRQL